VPLVYLCSSGRKKEFDSKSASVASSVSQIYSPGKTIPPVVESLLFDKEPLNVKGDLFLQQAKLPLQCRITASVKEFDALKLTKLTEHPLAAISVAAFRQVALVLELDLSKLQNFALAVERLMPNNSYHNAAHIIDVLQLTYLQITSGPIHEVCRDPIVKLSALLAALVHDLAHPGCNNAFLMASDHPIVRKFGRQSPAETMHAAVFKELISVPEMDFIENLTSNDRQRVLRYVEATILATDMSKHSDYLHADVPSDPEKNELFNLAFAIKVSDMSHNFRSFPVHNKFVDMLKEEFYHQGEEEQKLHLEVTAGMSRDETYADVCDFQHHFLSFVIEPLLQRWSAHSNGSPLVDEMQQCLKQNISIWKMLSVRRAVPEPKDSSKQAQTAHRSFSKLRLHRFTHAFTQTYGFKSEKCEMKTPVDLSGIRFSPSAMRSLSRPRLTVPHSSA